ncbi:UBX domain-containing protein 2A [Denticeps clupeoides]|uniref:UBX domain-containing protein 2A n=1 Tax=Denticeps clupeoides TaxID=299321 RepID=A0AAY4BKS9_9TELE|nr:UBX domain-containing protein 2A [Denticeps clupeoides]XP_028808871.1 UBX domain-containing protein 2A [Denticeps clupeoides]
MKDIDARERVKDDTWCEQAENVEEEAPTMRRSFSVEDLLDEVEKLSSATTDSKKVEIVVRLWKDGFTVNDEDLRSYSQEENQEFLEAIKRGELPSELEGRAEEEELEVNVEDMKDEMYVPRKKIFYPFTGRGYRLGSVAPQVVARSLSVHEDASEPPMPVVEVDDEQPLTSLQIWLADGRRLVQKFNLAHKISDVEDFVEQTQSTSFPFILTTSLPFRELTNKELSLEEADIVNAVIVQRPLNPEADPFRCS